MRKLFRYILISLALLLLSCCIFPAFATTRTVTNCADSGVGSLRYALSSVEAGDEVDDMREVVDLQNPDFLALAEAFGLPSRRTGSSTDADLADGVRWLIGQEGPALLEVKWSSPTAEA